MRKHRVNKKTRKAMNRSCKAECPICSQKTPLEEHHIQGRKIQNADHESNLCSICPTCHTKIHMGLLILEGWFTTTKGKELFWHKPEQESFTGEKKIPYIM